MSSAIRFNLDQSKMLSFGIGLSYRVLEDFFLKEGLIKQSDGTGPDQTTRSVQPDLGSVRPQKHMALPFALKELK